MADEKTSIALVLKKRTEIKLEQIDVDKQFYKLNLETQSGETKLSWTVPEELIPEWIVEAPMESIIDIEFKKTQKTLQDIEPKENLDDGKNEKLEE